MSERFYELEPAPLDPIMQANAQWKEYQSEFDDPVNTTVGVMIDPVTNKPWQPEAVTIAHSQALSVINHDKNFGYQSPAGHTGYLREAARFTFNTEHGLESSGLQAWQTLGGTGALSLAKDSIEQLVKPSRRGQIELYLDSGWPNHKAIFTPPGYWVNNAPRLDGSGAYDHKSYMDWLQDADKNTVVLVQACGYNDDGMDRSAEQWDEIMRTLAEKDATVIVDAAYLGLASETIDERNAIDSVIERQPLAFICTSASKNMGLYNERLGALFMLNAEHHMSSKQAKSFVQQVTKNARRTVSNPPLLVAETAARALLPESSYKYELQEAAKVLQENRTRLGEVLEGHAPNLSSGKGLFTKLLPDGFSRQQQDYLREEGILTLPNSRINIGGIAPDKIERVGGVLLKALRDK